MIKDSLKFEVHMLRRVHNIDPYMDILHRSAVQVQNKEPSNKQESPKPYSLVLKSYEFKKYKKEKKGLP